jgi:hypothetical protein
MLPPKVKRPKSTKVTTEYPAHRKWVRGHQCCVPGCQNARIECAHVRSGTNGGIGLKPSDNWCISLCSGHHSQQHSIGESSFEKLYNIDMKELAKEFARKSPDKKLREAIESGQLT